MREGVCPLPRKFLNFLPENGTFSCILEPCFLKFMFMEQRPIKGQKTISAFKTASSRSLLEGERDWSIVTRLHEGQLVVRWPRYAAVIRVIG